jgi:hypothetical protein
MNISTEDYGLNIDSLAKNKEFTFLHMLTYPEVLLSKIPVGDIHGELWAGKDRRLETAGERKELWHAWLNAVSTVARGDYERFKEIPQHVHEYFQNVKMLSNPPEEATPTATHHTNPAVFEGDPYGGAKVTAAWIDEAQAGPSMLLMPSPLKTPKFTWSYTAMNDFETCPLKYAGSRYYKTVKFEETKEILWGNRKHKANELALKGSVVPASPTAGDVDWKYVNALKAASEGGELLVEQQIAINSNLVPVGWFAQDAWGRGVIDVAIIKDGVAKIYDWKTGKVKLDETQLKIFCMFLALAHKEVQRFEARFIWLKDDSVSDPVILNRSEIFPIVKDVLARVERMEQAWNAEIFQARTSGLCKKYCGVIECAHCGKGSRG